MTADEAKVILKDEINNDLIKCIYEYWRGKRLKYVNNNFYYYYYYYSILIHFNSKETSVNANCIDR